MKQILFFFLLLISFQGFSQTEYYDALFLMSNIGDVKGVRTISTKFNPDLIDLQNKLKVEKDIPTQKKLDAEIIEMTNSINDRILSILKNYFPDMSILSNDDINNYLKNTNNGFIKSFQVSGTVKSGGSPVIKSLSSITKNIGGANVTDFADGLAKFMVERFKQELSITFFKKFKEDMNSSKYSDLQILFPKTLKTLNTIDKNIYQYNIYLNSLREAFKMDLSGIYSKLDDVVNQKKYSDYFDQHLELKSMLTSSFYLIQQISSGVNPGKILADFDVEKLKFNSNNVNLQTNLRSSIETMQIFSESFKSKSKDNYWISGDSISLLENEVSFRIYLGLICQNPKIKSIKFQEASSEKYLKDVLYSVADKWSDLLKYRQFLTQFVYKSNDVTSYFNDLKDKKSRSEIDFNDFYKLFNSSLDLFEHSFTFLDLPSVNKVITPQILLKVHTEADRWISVSRSASDLFLDVKKGNYSSSIMNTITIVDKLLISPGIIDIESYKKQIEKANTNLKNDANYLKLSENEKSIIDSLIQVFATKNSGNSIRYFEKSEFFHSLNKSIKELAVEIINLNRDVTIYNSLKNQEEIRNVILKYGSFMAAVVNAENSDDVKNAIQSVAMPVGSYSVKRETFYNVSINSYLGFYAGGEYLPALKQNPWAFSTGLTAPVGVAFSWGNYKNGLRDNPPLLLKKNGKDKGGLSGSLFISLIDIGALASFRLGNDSSAVGSEVQLQNIISPGIYYYVGLPKCPVSIGIGGQVGPQLRNITAELSNLEKNFYIRFGLNVVVDLPLLNIYSRNYKKEKS